MIKKLLPLILIVIIPLTACSNSSPKKVEEENTSTDPVVAEQKYYSPYTGEEVSEQVLNNKPYMVIVENSSSSRPQSGLSGADIIYETMAEGGIPRFIALFHKNSVEKIGPVRSARPYFISIAKDINLPFAHCGGSQEALDTIAKDSTYISINEMAQGSYFSRDNKRKAPHNLYTSSEKLLKYINDKKLSYTPNNSLVFSNEYWDNSLLDPLDRIILKLNKYYSTSYVFKDGYYVKSMDGTEAIDTNTNQALKFTNIVIQKTNIVTREDGRLNIKLDGSGETYVLSKGKIVKGTWRKDSSKTMLLDSNNTEIPLSKGNTIWHIISNDVTIPIE